MALKSLEVYRRTLEQAQKELAQVVEAKTQLESEIVALKKQIGTPAKLPVESLVETMLNNEIFKKRFEQALDEAIVGLPGNFESTDGQTEGKVVFSQSTLKTFGADVGEHLKRQRMFVATAYVVYQGLLHDGSTVESDEGGRVEGMFAIEFGSETYEDAEAAASEVTINILEIYKRP